MIGHKKQLQAEINKVFSSLSPERIKEIDEAFKDGSGDIAMRQMHFGGDVSYSADLRQVELNGEFSMQDLLRIVSAMKT